MLGSRIHIDKIDSVLYIFFQIEARIYTFRQKTLQISFTKNQIHKVQSTETASMKKPFVTYFFAQMVIAESLFRKTDITQIYKEIFWRKNLEWTANSTLINCNPFRLN